MKAPISSELLRRFDIAGPRYTSYPTADRFVDAFGANEYQAALAQRGAGIAALALPLSLYVHLPFCQSLCYYCACNKIVTRRPERGAEYLSYLLREVQLLDGQLGSARKTSHLHLGGGTPTFFNDEQLAQLLGALRRTFEFDVQAECAIEVDPRTVDVARLHRLAQLGFNRLSLGVQDFDETVQHAVHRVQSTQRVFDLVEEAPRAGFASVSVDLIYGLPKQTEHSFQTTVEQLLRLRPDRIALYAYAHLPVRFKPQRRIAEHDLPSAATKIAMLTHAIAALGTAGYDYVGMDHFALPQDTLAVAKRQGWLRRNFQGYSAQTDCDVIGLGVSAIGQVGASYVQNAKALNDYYDLIDHNQLPTERGIALARDDLLRRSVIMALMCQGEVDYEAVEAAYLIDFKRYFASELVALRRFADDGLLSLHDKALRLSQRGWYLVRPIAMVFDAYLKAALERQRFSRVI